MNHKKCKNWVAVIICLVLGVGVPLAVHFLSPSVVSEISADGMLTYIVEAISAIATFTLALVALWQTSEANKMTDKANALSERMLEVEENQYKLELRPFIMVTAWRGLDVVDKSKIYLLPDEMYIEADGCDSEKDKLAGLELTLFNSTNGYISVTFNGAKSEEIEWKECYSGQPKSSVSIMPGESGKITFIGKPEFFRKQKGKTIHFKFILENRIAQRYQEEFDVIIISFSDSCVHKDNEYYCHLVVQNFAIGKFEKKMGSQY